LLDLLPLSAAELRTAAYVATYVERDVRQILGIGDLLAFQTFLRLAAARTKQLLNLSQLGSDAGVSHNTAKSWLGVLEASYLALRLPPFSRNLSKRGLEVDLLVERGTRILGVEAKSGATVPLEAFAPLGAVAELVPELDQRVVVHGGDSSHTTTAGRAISFREIDDMKWLSR
jgi:hypothetical protein